MSDRWVVNASYDLLSVGFRLDQKVIREALYRTVGELWD